LTSTLSLSSCLRAREVIIVVLDLVKEKSGASFTQKLGEDELKFFNEVCNKPFAEQAVSFLNAYWPEVNKEAEFIYAVAWDYFIKADMHAQGISLIYKYTEGASLEFDIGLYFYEQLCKYCEDSKNANFVNNYQLSKPTMMTSLARKQELRDKVDVNFDNRVSFLEYLLYQYRSVANPADFCKRSMGHDEHPEIKKARLALAEVQKKINAFEEEKERLTKESEGTGVKALGAKNMLAQIESSPLKAELNKALITAEAAVRIASKKFGGQGANSDGGNTEGAVWGLNRDLEEKKKKKYGPKSK